MPSHTIKPDKREPVVKAPIVSPSTAPEQTTWHTVLVPIANLSAWGGNPRETFAEEPLQELADSIARIGMLQPLTVRPILGSEESDGPCYQVIAGGRRLRAARLAGLESVPCVVRDVEERDALLIAISENDQRTDVNPLERARSYARLLELDGVNQMEIARRLNRSQTWVSAYVRLLELPDAVQRLVASGALTLGHAKALQAYKEFPALLTRIAEIAAQENTSVRTLEQAELPFGDQLKKDGIVKEMFRYYGTSTEVFPECNDCPLQARRDMRQTSGSYCLRPDHYAELKTTRLKAAEEAAARSRAALLEKAKGADVRPVVSERAEALDRRADRTAEVEAKKADSYGEKQAPAEPEKRGLQLSDLKYGEYQQLYEYSGTPAGCSRACPCHVEVQSGTRLIPVCLDPKRHTSLKAAETRAAQKSRKVVFDELRKRILDKPYAYRLKQALANLLMPQVYGVAVEIRRNYAPNVPPGPFRTVLEGTYFNSADRKVLDAMEAMEVEDLITHVRNLVVWAELHRAYENKFDVPSEVRAILHCDREGQELEEEPLAEALPQVTDTRNALGVDETPEPDEEEEIEPVYCEHCEEEIPAHYIGHPVVAETNFPQSERHQVRLESGLMVFTVEGAEYFYCKDCAPTIKFCAGCGCTYEIACPGGCFWVPGGKNGKPFCSACAQTNPVDDGEDPACSNCHERRALSGGTLCRICADVAAYAPGLQIVGVG